MIQMQFISDLIPPEILAGLDSAAVGSVVNNVAQAARNHWIRLAEKDNDFGSHLRFDYINGIQPIEYWGSGVAVISLVGELPHMLEDGAPRLNMRQTLLGSGVPIAAKGKKGKRVSKSGEYYRSIPLRHTTLGSARAPRGKTVGQEMGSAYSGHNAVADSKKLGKQIYAAAKQLSATRTGSGKQGGYGQRLEAGLAPKLKEHHKTDIYAGMLRIEAAYEQATSSQYVTFRTISTATDEGWFRAAFPARNYASSVSKFIEDLVPKAVAALLESP